MKKFLLSSLYFLTPASLFAAEAVAPKDGRGQQGAFWQTLIMIAIAIVFFYFILWRPEQRRRKAMEKKRTEMKKGDKVTAMGIVGTIDQIKEGTVVLKMVDGSKIEMLKGAISDVLPDVKEEVK